MLTLLPNASEVRGSTRALACSGWRPAKRTSGVKQESIGEGAASHTRGAYAPPGKNPALVSVVCALLFSNWANGARAGSLRTANLKKTFNWEGEAPDEPGLPWCAASLAPEASNLRFKLRKKRKTEKRGNVAATPKECKKNYYRPVNNKLHALLL